MTGIDGTSTTVSGGCEYLYTPVGVSSTWFPALPSAAFQPSEGYHYTEMLSQSTSTTTITYPADYPFTTVFTIQ